MVRLETLSLHKAISLADESLHAEFLHLNIAVRSGLLINENRSLSGRQPSPLAAAFWI